MTEDFQFINPTSIQENLMFNNDLIRQFLALYQTQIPIDFEALKKAIISKDHTEITNKAHHIKPTMEYIGATVLRQNLQSLESAGKQQIDISCIEQMFEQIEPMFAVLLKEIDEYLQSL
ncbi:Hpt domain-containing protein [Sphingobacterium sp. LRF_L2]|uniref:Hpt domain-containing protein n=1 Tax=Sphingobacterium sp. LRF_L2 TaxID=3369421 RepID=UPI003F61505A